MFATIFTFRGVVPFNLPPGPGNANELHLYPWRNFFCEDTFSNQYPPFQKGRHVRSVYMLSPTLYVDRFAIPVPPAFFQIKLILHLFLAFVTPLLHSHTQTSQS